MGYKGYEDIRKLITKNIDSRILIDLVSDLLFSKGFSKIHKTDGPGDGGRDLYAELDGERTLVQCKYHEDGEKTCSSRELSELPMALIKFNYSKGLFITNAKISPQAKREYLDNYPNLQLSFIDGDELGLLVLESPLLRSIWFDGESICKREPSIRIPFLVREHVDDLPYVIKDHAGEDNLVVLEEKFKDVFPNLKIRILASRMDTDRFEPYKAPLPLTIEEGGGYRFLFSQLVVEGLDSLASIESFKNKVVYLLLDWMKEKLCGFSLRFGKSYIAARNNDGEGTEIDLDLCPSTYIVTESYIGRELDFISVDGQVDWTGVNDARVTEAGYIRLYNQELNVCLDYKIKTRVGWKAQLEKLASKERLKAGWEKSIFCLIEKFESWPFEHIPEPDEHIDWVDGKHIVCGWLHFSLLGYPSQTRGRSKDGFASVLMLPDEIEFEHSQQNIKSALLRLSGVEILDPNKARHMIAITGNDMFDIPEEYFYICGEVISYPEDIPSPILPNSRLFHLELVLANKNPNSFLNLDFLEMVDSLKYVYGVEVYTSTHFCHLCIHLNIESIAHEYSRGIVEKISMMAMEIISIITTASPSDSFVATKEYWKANYNVSLGSSWENSRKIYTFRNSGGEPMDYKDVMKILTS
ncbi:restriction endonuclease [Aeromonas dhakensis]|uniref:restriction endonuclease n=1 Tax=Aeromonas dhakensis TaxID=196024 RepID=UPI00191E5DFB|nr:restriction endonuclease [Aeromonas dhakensis]MBL0673888.1 restriction endonuclease [Aeromonas dhakensis]MDX7742424.1 restriction endonuclease [Aeromonas dhakensis]